MFCLLSNPHDRRKLRSACVRNSGESLQAPRDFPAHSTPCLAHTPPPLGTGVTQSLVDLLDLHKFGEPVIWPPGFDAQKAKHFVQDYKQAICVCQLYGYSSP